MNTYVILLRQMEGILTPASLRRSSIAGLAESSGILLLDVLAVAGIFDAALLCRAPNSDAVRVLLDARYGWRMKALLATGPVRFQEGCAEEDDSSPKHHPQRDR